MPNITEMNRTEFRELLHTLVNFAFANCPKLSIIELKRTEV